MAWDRPGGWNSTGGDELPTQTGHIGEFLTTDGSAAAWEETVEATASRTSITTAGAVTYTAAQVLGGVIHRDPNGATRIDTFPTATELVAAIPNCHVGQSWVTAISNAAPTPIAYANIEDLMVSEGADMTFPDDLDAIGGMALIHPGSVVELLFYVTSVSPPAIKGKVLSQGGTIDIDFFPSDMIPIAGTWAYYGSGLILNPGSPYGSLGVVGSGAHSEPLTATYMSAGTLSAGSINTINLSATSSLFANRAAICCGGWDDNIFVNIYSGDSWSITGGDITAIALNITLSGTPKSAEDYYALRTECSLPSHSMSAAAVTGVRMFGHSINMRSGVYGGMAQDLYGEKVYFDIWDKDTGTLSSARGYQSYLYYGVSTATSAGVIDIETVSMFEAVFQLGKARTTTLYGFHVDTITSTMTADNYYGAYFKAPTGRIASAFGIFIGDHSGVGTTSAFGLYVSGSAAKSNFDGTLNVGTLYASTELCGSRMDTTTLTAGTIYATVELCGSRIDTTTLTAGTVYASTELCGSRVDATTLTAGTIYASTELCGSRTDTTTLTAGTISTTNSVIGIAGTLADHSFNGLTIPLTAGETLVFGNVVCISAADGKAYTACADSANHMPVIGMATSGITANQIGSFLIKGTASDASWAWGTGQILYACTTAGVMSAQAPAVATNQVQSIAVALTATMILFEPNYVLVEV